MGLNSKLVPISLPVNDNCPLKHLSYVAELGFKLATLGSAVRHAPDRHMEYIQRRLNVDATSWHCIDVEATLYLRHVPAGLLPALWNLAKKNKSVNHINCWSQIYPAFANCVNWDQLASEPNDLDLQCLSFTCDLYQQHGSSNLIGWKLVVGMTS